MKNKLIILVLVLFQSNSYAQQLTIEETFNYIENIENVYHGYIDYFPEKIKIIVKYSLSNDGILSKGTYLQEEKSGDIIKINIVEGSLIITNRTKNLNDKTISLSNVVSVNVNDLQREIKYDNNGSLIKFICKTNKCFTVNGQYKNDGIAILVEQEYQALKLIKAVNYLFSLIDEKEFTRDLDDPFSSISNTKIVSPNKSKFIKLTESNGIYQIPVKFGTLNKKFVLDSGASDITISSSLEKELLKNGLVNKKVNLTDALYRVASGEVISHRRILISQITVGDFTVKNVIASVGNENTPLLLGKSFFDNFKSWSINNIDNMLQLNN